MAANISGYLDVAMNQITKIKPYMKRPKSFAVFGKNCIGHTLIELMIALVVGLILVSAISGTYVWSSRNYRQADNSARLQENARFALDSITEDLRMTSFTHEAIAATSIDISLVSSALVSDCGVSGDDWAVSTGSLIESYSQTTASVIASNYSCINSSYLHTLGNSGSEFTGILATKYVREPDGALDDGKLYLQTTIDGQSRMIVQNHSGTPSVAAFDSGKTWEYVVNVYYLQNDDGLPTLYRKTLQGTNLDSLNTLKMDTEAGGLAEGIEYFHITWGIDHEMVDGSDTTRADGNANYFVSSPTVAQAPGVVAAKVFVLVRSENFDASYVDDKQYLLGDITLPPSGTFNDGFRRKVFSTTVKFRNAVIKNDLLSYLK